jgi:hypothetical protein
MNAVIGITTKLIPTLDPSADPHEPKEEPTCLCMDVL